jgi:hypothetical protein
MKRNSKCALPLLGVDEPPLLVDLVAVIIKGSIYGNGCYLAGACRPGIKMVFVSGMPREGI